jgi:hypothetical protein
LLLLFVSPDLKFQISNRKFSIISNFQSVNPSTFRQFFRHLINTALQRGDKREPNFLTASAVFRRPQNR